MNKDGHIDIVAGTYDGSPYVAWGSKAGWVQPVQIMDKSGSRIVTNAFWNYETKKWDNTHRCDPEGETVEGAHATSAAVMDWDGDGDFDLIIGDYSKGHVFLRSNGGKAAEPGFELRNEFVSVDGKPLIVPTGISTPRPLDWDGDGLIDLLCSSMGDTWRDAEGGAVMIHRNIGTAQDTKLGSPDVLIAASAKGHQDVVRPDSGLYVDAGDVDGDGDLDLLVGGYSHWTPPARTLSTDEAAKAEDLKKRLKEIDDKMGSIQKEMSKEFATLAANNKDNELPQEKVDAVMKKYQEPQRELNKQRNAIKKELDVLVPSAQRHSFVWWYERL